MTAGSRIMLPTYPAVFLLLAGFLYFQDPDRTQGGAFDVAAYLLPIPMWGVMFAVIGTVEVFALAFHRRSVYQWMVVAGAGVCAFWALLILMSASGNSDVSWTSGIWPMALCVAHIATASSLSRDLVVRSP